MSDPKAVALIACSATKLDHPAPARDLYTGHLFRASVRYAESRGMEWRVLSAKHHLVHPDTVLEPYDVRLGSKATGPAIWPWTYTVIDQLATSWHEPVHLQVLAGKQYRVTLAERLVWDRARHPEQYAWCAGYEAPLDGLSIGLQKQWLAANTLQPTVA